MNHEGKDNFKEDSLKTLPFPRRCKRFSDVLDSVLWVFTLVLKVYLVPLWSEVDQLTKKKKKKLDKARIFKN